MPNDGECAVCGGSLAGRRKDARYCSMSCKTKASRARHREYIQVYLRGYYERNREALNAQGAEYRKRHGDEQRAKDRKRYAENPEVKKERSRRWKAANPERAREIALRRSLLRPTGPYAELVLGDPCSYCGAPAEDVDHIEPIATGGPNEWDNYTAACHRCNNKKQANSLLHFMRNGLIDAELQAAA